MKREVIFNATGLLLVALIVVGCSPPAQTEDTSAVSALSDSEEGSTQADETVEEVNYLFVQGARGSSLEGGVLRLIDIDPATLFFSDRPDRITGHLTTEEFIANWSEGDDSFASDPPNATLSILSGELKASKIGSSSHFFPGMGTGPYQVK